MNTRIIGILLVSIMCITVAASAAAAHSTPFVINGNVSDSNSNPCNGAWVQVTNTNTIVGWDAENDSESNYYRLVLDSDDVSAGNILQFEASGCSEIKMMEHTVTQSELNDGGMIGIDIVFDVESMPDLTVTAIGTPVRLRADVINPISATVENIGSENATSFIVTLEAGGSIVDTDTVTSLNAGESTTVEFLWTPSSEGEYTLNVTADANSEVTESDETNNSRIATETVLDTLTATVNVRIEGKDDMVWCGDVTLSSSVLVATDGSTHYLNEPTALGALDEADKLGGFGYVLDNGVYGLYVPEVAGEQAFDWNGWMYRVNYVMPPWIGAADYTLADNDEALWFFGPCPVAPPLKIELDKTTVITGETFVATVTAYNDSTELFDPVDTAEVYVDGILYALTGLDGTLTMSLAAGDYQIHADKGTWATYTRSEKVDLTVTTATATYDFTTGANPDRWAYRYQTDAKPAVNDIIPDIEFVTAAKPNKDQYLKISTDNRKMQSDSTDLEGYYAAHRFVFNISQSVEDILTIEVLWNGKGAHTDRKKSGATLYIWNGTGYEELDNTTSNKEVYLSAELTEELENYIDANNGYLTVLVEQNSEQTMKGKRSLVSKLSTDYVKVDITHT